MVLCLHESFVADVAVQNPINKACGAWRPACVLTLGEVVISIDSLFFLY